MKKKFLTLISLVFAGGVSAAQGTIGLTQCTSITTDTFSSTCSGKPLIFITGNTTDYLAYSFVEGLLGNVTTSKCTLTVSGFDKNLNPVDLDGGTVTLNLDAKTSTMHYSNPAFQVVTGLHRIGADGSIEHVIGYLTLADNNTNIYFKDTTCVNKK